MAEKLLLLISVIAFALAVFGAGTGWQVTARPWSGQYSLRFLLILLAVGPPLIGLSWAHREAILGAFDSAEREISRSTQRPPRAQASRPSSRRTSPPQRFSSPTWPSHLMQLVEQITEQRLTASQRDLLNRMAAIGSGIFASLAIALLAAAFRKSHSWRRAPRRSPLTWSALLLAVLATATFLGFVATLPNLQLPPSDATQLF